MYESQQLHAVYKKPYFLLFYHGPTYVASGIGTMLDWSHSNIKRAEVQEGEFAKTQHATVVTVCSIFSMVQ